MILTMLSNSSNKSLPVISGGEKAGRWVGRMVSKGSRRDAILHSVGTVLRDTRLSNLTMKDIAVELGITKGNLYYYFKDKQDILFQCHMRCMDLSLDALHAILAGHSGENEPLHALLVQHIAGMLENGFGSVLLTDLDNLTPFQRSLYVARRDEFEAGVRQLIETGVQRGVYVCDDVKLASLAMLGAINWLPKWYRPEGLLTADEVAHGLANFLMKALQPKADPTKGAAKHIRDKSGPLTNSPTRSKRTEVNRKAT
jgi:AcrR family transcriptional regulator